MLYASPDFKSRIRTVGQLGLRITFILIVKYKMNLAVVLVAVLVTISARLACSQSSCSSAILGLAPCLGYTTGVSSVPSSACCTQLSNVVQQQPECLCTLLTGAAPFGITVNNTLAFVLPDACDVKMPPLSDCNGVTAGPPSKSTTPPTTTERGSPPPPSDVQSGNGSKTTEEASGSAVIVRWRRTAVTSFFSFVITMFVFSV